MKSENQFPVHTRLENGEVLNTFPLVKDLFSLAKKQIGEDGGFESYTNPEHKDGQSKAVELPEKFSPIVADYPGNYFVVCYEDRFGSYYAPDTRFRLVRLSTVKHRYDSDKVLREVDVMEHEQSEGKGNVIFVSVADRVNEKSVINLNSAKEGGVDAPHGSAKITYEVNANGEKRMTESDFERLDEAMHDWNGVQKPVRWVRNLDVEKVSAGEFKLIYQDMYLIGRDTQGLTEEEARVKISIEGSGDSAKSILIEIGLGSLSSAETLFEDSRDGVKVVSHSVKGMKVFKNQMKIIEQDPNYAFLFERPIDKAKLMDLVWSKIRMLEADWDKPQAVFGTDRIADLSPNLLEDKK